jgi:hypothetical protein
MQTGYDPVAARVLGTPVAAEMPSACAAAVQGGLAQRIYDNSQQYVESISERNCIFRRRPPMLQGMSLANVPTGAPYGYGQGPPGHVVVGTWGDGDSVRMPTLFTVPSENPRVTVMPSGPLTGGYEGSETVFREADAKTRNARGAMSVKRAEQEAAVSRKRATAARMRMFEQVQQDLGLQGLQQLGVVPELPSQKRHRRGPGGGGGGGGGGGSGDGGESPGPSSPTPSSFEPTGTPGPAGGPSGAGRPHKRMTTSFLEGFMNFWDNLGALARGQMTEAHFQREFVQQQQWVPLLALVLILLVIIFVCLFATCKAT